MSKEAPIKNPFVNGSISEVFSAEAISYTIQVGDDAFSYKGNVVFTKQQTITLYHKILHEIIKGTNSENDKERRVAMHSLTNLRIWPLRIH